MFRAFEARLIAPVLELYLPRLTGGYNLHWGLFLLLEVLLNDITDLILLIFLTYLNFYDILIFREANHSNFQNPCNKAGKEVILCS